MQSVKLIALFSSIKQTFNDQKYNSAEAALWNQASPQKISSIEGGQQSKIEVPSKELAKDQMVIMLEAPK